MQKIFEINVKNVMQIAECGKKHIKFDFSIKNYMILYIMKNICFEKLHYDISI